MAAFHKYSIWLLLSVISILAFNPLPVSGGEGEYVPDLNRIYDGINTVEGSFKQVTYIKDMDIEQVYEGVFHLKMPDRVRWKYTGGSTDEAYLDRDKVVLYQPSESQAFLSSTESYGMRGSPLSMLLRLDRLESEYMLARKGRNIRLEPRGYNTFVKSIQLVFAGDKFALSGITVNDSYGNITSVRLADIEINRVLPDSLFIFDPPEGTTVIDQN